MTKTFLPISREDLKKRGWDRLDIIIVTGDAYVDHPSYGSAVIGRVLEDAGYRVGIIAQPRHDVKDDFLRLGSPRLFFGITAGNLDSMVANYTANKRLRSDDDYSPGGKAALRPDRASIVYTNRIRELFPGTPVLLGGIEASLRRLAHYDYWSDKVRRSLLLDSKADILVYGMGEAQVLEIARRLEKGAGVKEIGDVRGTVVAKNSTAGYYGHIEVPSFEDIAGDKNKFIEAFKTIYLEADPLRGKAIAQRHGDRYVIQLPPALPLKREDLDRYYNLPYARSWHPSYDAAGGVPGFEAVKFSVVSHRGCSGGCNFCSLYLHQGRIVQSRSEGSIIKEVRELALNKDFKGTITDVGGPTANLYRAECDLWKSAGTCRNRRCLVPEKCKNLKLGYAQTLKLLREIKKIPSVKHVFIGSGVRHDLLTEGYSDEYLKAICKDHVSGYLKVAPEHCAEETLRLMNKPSFGVYEKFADRFDRMATSSGKKQYLVSYFLSAHPGSTLNDALELAVYLARRRIHPEQIQDYIPLPMTMSGAIYYTGKDPFTGKPVYVARNLRERKLQRALIQYYQPKNRKYVIEALRKLGRMDLKKLFSP